MIETALRFAKYARKRVFPVNPYSKRPLIKVGTGFANASSDPRQIEQWWSEFRGSAMVGMPTGQINGIFVLDVDRHSDAASGIDTLQRMLDGGRELPDTYTALTPSGGMHFYFRYPDGVDIRNSTGKIGPGLDIRGNGGFVVAPGSVRYDGKMYSFTDSIELADAPQWLVDECLKPAPKKGLPVRSKAEIVISGGCTALAVAFPDRYRRAVLRNSKDRVANARKGTRNNTLFYNAVSLYSFLAGGVFKGEQDLTDEMIYACEMNRLIADDGRNSVLDTLESAKSHGFRNPIKIVRGN